MQAINNSLQALEPLAPRPTRQKPDYKTDPEIRAVIFDVYGTMLISASGDIGKTEPDSRAVSTALRQAGIKSIQKDHDLTAKLIVSEFDRTIINHHRIRFIEGIKYPEVDIRDVWHDVLLSLCQRGTIKAEIDRRLCARLAFLFELACNPVWPMPGIKETLAELQKFKIPTGIVSNAQFYTPLTMRFMLNSNHITEDNLEKDINTPGFNDDLQSYSYRMLRAKPDPALYQQLIPTIENKYGLQPEQVLFVGNDMLKDILPARQTGLKTCLFAGDQRSLRMREDEAMTENLKPNHIITEIKQLTEIIRP